MSVVVYRLFFPFSPLIFDRSSVALSRTRRRYEKRNTCPRRFSCRDNDLIVFPTVFASIESDCLEEHDFYRSKHGTPALQYNWELAKRAQKLANFLTKNEPPEKVTNGMYDANFFIASWPTARTISDAVENW